MPVTFDPDHSARKLATLVDAQLLSAEARVYQRFYGLDLAARKVPAASRLGRFEVDGFGGGPSVVAACSRWRRCSCSTASTTTWGCIGM
jgi:hypothetical protein